MRRASTSEGASGEAPMLRTSGCTRLRWPRRRALRSYRRCSGPRESPQLTDGRHRNGPSVRWINSWASREEVRRRGSPLKSARAGHSRSGHARAAQSRAVHTARALRARPPAVRRQLAHSMHLSTHWQWAPRNLRAHRTPSTPEYTCCTARRAPTAAAIARAAHAPGPRERSAGPLRPRPQESSASRRTLQVASRSWHRL